MADRFCVGATTNTTASWSDTSGGASGFSIPVAGDNVYFDANSPSCRIDANFVCRSIDCLGYINTLTHGLGFSISIGDATAGAGNICLRLVAGMSYLKEHPSNCSLAFVTTSATQQTIYWGGKIMGDMNFNASSNGSWLFMSDCNWTDLLATMTFTKGTLNTNGYTCNGGQFTSSNSNTRVLTLGATIFNLSGVGNNCWLCSTITGLTVTANTAIVKMYRSLQCFAPLMQLGSMVWGIGVQFYNGGIATFFPSSTTVSIRHIKVYGGADLGDGREDRLQLNNSGFTVTDTVDGIVWSGYSSSRRQRIHSNNGAVRTITVPNATCVSGQYCDINVVTLTVTNDLSAITGGAGDLGGNTGIIFTTGITYYWYSTSGGVKNWADDVNWFLATGGTGGQARKPLPQDHARFDANSVNASGTTIRCGVGSERLGRNIDWTGCLNTPTWDFQVDVINYGNLTLIAGMSLTAYAFAFFNMNGNGAGNTFTLTSAGQVFPHIQFQFNMASTNTYTFADDFNAISTCLVSFFSGILNSNNKNMTSGRFTFDTHSVTNGTSIFTATILTGTPFNITSFMTTYSCASAEFRVTGTGTGAKAITGSATSRVHGKLTISGAGDCTYTFSGTNTFGDFATKATKHTLAFTTGTTTTFTGTITCVGSAGNYITLRSTTSTAFTWSKSSGTVNCDYLNLSKSTASGGATFNAGSNTIDGGGNTGWTGLVTDPFTWTGADFAVNLNYSNPLNWQGLVAPGIGNIVYFTGLGTIRNCKIDVASSCKGINISLAYTGVITQSANFTIDTEGVEQYGGTFTGGAFAISNAGRFKRIAGVWTNNSGTFSQTAQGTGVDTWIDSGGTFSANSGTVEIVGSLDAVITNASTRQFNHIIYNFFF